MRMFWLLALVCVAPLTHAAIYKYVDQDGNITYTNIPRAGARRLQLTPLSTISAGTAHANPGPANFPRVSTSTQEKRDAMRRELLQHELAGEEGKLAAAQQALKAGEAVRLGNERNYQKYLDRVQGLKDAVLRHQQNVDALKKQLGE
ncbi:MAG: DUF4124 domain-containing protein [Betaproteobacteria bacterium]|nr:DUF4124 domain-containing protein [Betaproteobacteria bacterium]